MAQGADPQLRLTYARTIGVKAVSSTDGLMLFGPTVQVSIGIHEHLEKALESKGERVPDRILGDAMIDTGATTTTISAGVAEKLNLSRSGTVTAAGIGGASTGFRAACNVDIKGLRVNIPRAHCHNLPQIQSLNLVALIGRDILRHMVLTYDGVNGTVTLTLPLAGSLKGQKHARPQPAKRRRRRPRKR